MVQMTTSSSLSTANSSKLRAWPVASLGSVSCFHRNRLHHNAGSLPYRSIAIKAHRGRRSRISSFIAFLSILVATVFVLHRLLSSFIVIDSENNPNSNNINSKPLWTSCPSTDMKEEREKNDEDNDICFVTCIFGENVRDVDHPANVDWFKKHWCHTRFLLVTNLPDLPAPGWTKIVSQTATGGRDGYTTNTRAAASDNNNQVEITKNHIIQSRHAKFLAWDVLTDITPKHCAAVVYTDGYLIPKRYTNRRSFLVSIFFSSPWSPSSPLFGWLPRIPGVGKHRPQIPPPAKFQNIVRQVRSHPWGLSQVKQRYFDGLPMTTLLNNLVRDRKDTKEHVEKTLEWFRAQTTDFREIMPYYLNKYFAYDPNNARYRELSSYFWKTYTTYGGLWRDQPLWAYVLHHFNVTPAVMTTEGTITKGGDLFETGGKLGWDKHVYV
mmetsp:Transcript_17485/g.38247  ORF Transcript_17485/g.38247 Transcript_17485/m.38247 type:complete len:437 (-) Transcript_17485:1257-2567(-)|eukprot:CAMPEP_0168177162 /NCGR_PEP_ID=MMETSP0139_2-20121125/8275_1 /TAXON_ID=44445 /ORGANISM="Pseudo-nitzschia australis, Strain 10249 10 AB" /LENGTH=436 /DNA_ID=CAMNT_0008096131 /DNA_START=84 /DNA_END=1394 /DNA_ORIENTATION=-